MQRKKNTNGFTLVELMITVAIVGILASIAVPMYGDYLMESRRTDAQVALMNMAALQERYYLQNNTYASNSDIDQVGGSSTDRGYYTLSITSADASAFTLKASAVSGKPQENDTACPAIYLSSTGAKTPSECWK